MFLMYLTGRTTAGTQGFVEQKIKPEVYDFVLNDEVMNYKIDKIPATAIVG